MKAKSFDDFLNERENSLLSHEEIEACEYFKKILERGFVLDSTPRQYSGMVGSHMIDEFNFQFKFPKKLVIDPFFAITVPDNYRFNPGHANDTKSVKMSYIAFSNGYLRTTQAYGEVRPGVIFSGDKNSRINSIEEWENHFRKLYEYIKKNFEKWCYRQDSMPISTKNRLPQILGIYTPEAYSSQEEFRKKFSGFFEEDFISFCTETHEIPYKMPRNEMTENLFTEKNFLISLVSEKMAYQSLSFSDALREIITSGKMRAASVVEFLEDNVPNGLDDLLKDYRGEILSKRSGIV